MYPNSQSNYPGQRPMGGYSSSGQMGGYPSGQMGGYPSGQMGGYPSGQMGGYSSGQMGGNMSSMGGYSSSGQMGGYSSSGQMGNYPSGGNMSTMGGYSSSGQMGNYPSGGNMSSMGGSQMGNYPMGGSQMGNYPMGGYQSGGNMSSMSSMGGYPMGAGQMGGGMFPRVQGPVGGSILRVLKSEDELDKYLQKYDYVIMIFSSNTCNPCKQLAATIESSVPNHPLLSNLINRKSMIFVKINVGDFPDLADRFEVSSVPQVIVYVAQDGSYRGPLNSFPQLQDYLVKTCK
jgi:thiol-disulfide isomerase/thioredoxin